MMEVGDWDNVVDYLEPEHDYHIQLSQLPESVKLTRRDVFSRGDYQETIRDTDVIAEMKERGKKKWRLPNTDERVILYHSIRNFAPAIAYYPTLIFYFPKRIYLTRRPGLSPRDISYRHVFEDILRYDGQGYTLDDISRPVRGEKFIVPWVEFLAAITGSDEMSKVRQIIDRASAAVTRTVFGKWNEIFGENARGREIAVETNLEKGRRFDTEQRADVDSDTHDLYVWFEIEDGSRRFRVNDRSLGFRWFFCFLLFTQFRVSVEGGRGVLFLFDEPAANLHAAAQQRLIESFPEIARSANMLVYSTHSHYMIDPAWLEQTYIVTNRSDSPDVSIVSAATLDDESLDVRVSRYRAFANSHPSETSYFQTIVDRLEIVPSKFDISLPSVVLEVKSDYYILEFLRRYLKLDGPRSLPATGSGAFGALISISVGWGTKFLFLLDSDAAGLKEKVRYNVEFGARKESLVDIAQYVPGARAVESLLDKAALDKIKVELGLSKSPTKKDIQRFFQEYLARREFPALSSAFTKSCRKLLEGLQQSLDAL